MLRDLPLTPDEPRAITATLGPIQTGADNEQLQQVTIDPELSPEYAAHFANTLFWHIDGAHDQTVPCFGGSFRPVRLAPEGGETEFLNAYAAYAGLGEADRALVDGLRVVLSAATSGLSAVPDASDAQLAAWRRRPRAVQPLVWEHDTGRKSLMLGVSVSHVVGMAPADSYDLLCRLRTHMNRPDYVYRHAWRANYLGILDNTATLHPAPPFHPPSPRLLGPVTPKGSEAIRAPGAYSAG